MGNHSAKHLYWLNLCQPFIRKLNKLIKEYSNKNILALQKMVPFYLWLTKCTQFLKVLKTIWRAKSSDISGHKCTSNPSIDPLNPSNVCGAYNTNLKTNADNNDQVKLSYFPCLNCILKLTKNRVRSVLEARKFQLHKNHSKKYWHGETQYVSSFLDIIIFNLW